MIVWNRYRSLTDKLFEKVYIKDQKILQALSDVGIYITNYITGESLNSNIWVNMPEHFKINSTETNFLDFIHEDERPRIRQVLDDISKGKKNDFHEIFRIREKDGNYRWIHSYGKTVFADDDGKPILFIGSDSDISDLKTTELQLRESIEKEKQRFDEIETIRQIATIISSSLDMEETVGKILKETSRIIPYQTGSVQILQDNFLKIIGAEGFDDNCSICRMKFPFPQKGSLSTKALEEKTPFKSDNIELDFPTFTQPSKNRRIKSWIGIPLISHGDILGLLALDGYEKNVFTEHHLELAGTIGHHISIALENAMLHEKAYKMAMEDALTGIGNRHRFQMEGRIMLQGAVRTESELALIILDIDHFKSVNDRFGHATGDKILERVAAICSKEIRSIDLLARYGGEEFVILLPETGEKEALVAAERIRRKLEKTVHSETGETVTASFGIFSCRSRKEDRINWMLSQADKALYEAKRSGRNRCCVYTVNP